MTKHPKPADAYHPWRTYIDAREEARRRGDRKVGTEHLILGLLREPVLVAGPRMRPADSPRRARRDGSRCTRRSRHRRCVQRTTDTDRRADQTTAEADVQSRLAGPFATDTRSQDSAGEIVQRDTPSSPDRPATGAPHRPRARAARSRRRADRRARRRSRGRAATSRRGRRRSVGKPAPSSEGWNESLREASRAPDATVGPAVSPQR